MKISMQESTKFSELILPRFDCFIYSQPVDDRGKQAVDSLITTAGNALIAEYNKDEFELNISGETIDCELIGEYLCKKGYRNILLEGSTLGIVEIYLITKGLYEIGITSVTISYVEPSKYLVPMRTKLLRKRDFDLSDEVPGFNPIPGAICRLTDRKPQRGVFMLGYEERRLARAFEDFDMITPQNCHAVFGVPAFNPGWEMNAFANNLPVILEKKIDGGIYYCGAENPLSAYRLLVEISDSLTSDESMFVAPLGTKPIGIGAVLFTIQNNGVGLLYDHPVRKPGRSADVSKWHIYSVDFII